MQWITMRECFVLQRLIGTQNIACFIFSCDEATRLPLLVDFNALRNTSRLRDIWEVVKLTTLPPWGRRWRRWWRYTYEQNAVLSSVFWVHVSLLRCLAVVIHGFIVRARLAEDSTALCSHRALIADVCETPLILCLPLWLLTFGFTFVVYLLFLGVKQNAVQGEKLSSCTVPTFNPVPRVLN